VPHDYAPHGAAASLSRLTRPPRISHGVQAFALGLLFVFRRPALWPFALFPAALAAGLSALGVWASLSLLVPAVAQAFSSDGTLGGGAAQAIAWAAGLGAAAIAIFFAMAIAPPLSGPVLERIVAAQEADLGAPPRKPLGFFAEMGCGVRSVVFGAMLIVPSQAILWFADVLVPGAAFVTPPLKLLVAALAIAWNLVDYPLTLRGVPMRERFAVVMANRRAVLGFGLAFAALFWLPCCGLLLLGVGVAAATRLVWTVFYDRSTAMPS